MIQGPCCSIDSDSILSDMRKGVQKTIAFSNDANSLSALQDRIDNATSASLFEDFVPLDSLTRQASTLLFPCAYEGGRRLCGRAESFAMAKPINRNK